MIHFIFCEIATNLPVKKCYLLDGSDIQGEMVLAPSKAESMYITTDTDPETGTR